MSRHADRVRPLASRRRLSVLMALGALAAAACGSTSPAPPVTHRSPTPTPVPTATPTPVPTPVPTPTPIVPGATYTAPAVIQVENLDGARPQSGLGSANVIYEYSAEAGISRFTVIYFWTPKGRVGPIRSARLISPVLVGIWGGSLIYSGESQYMHNRLVTANTPRFDETTAGPDMFRITSRYAPHNLYTDGGRVDNMVRHGARTPVTYTLWSRAASAPGGRPVAGFVAPVSPSERPSYAWHPELNGWVRTEPDTGVFIDADNGNPVVAGTVVVMQVPARINPDDIESGCCTAGWEYALNGAGAAQVFTGGAEYDATWTQGPTGPPQFALAGGTPAPIGDGLVLIEVVPAGQTAVTR